MNTQPLSPVQAKHICSTSFERDAPDSIRRVETGFGSVPAAVSENAAVVESPDISGDAS